jgi:hypothetical protein
MDKKIELLQNIITSVKSKNIPFEPKNNNHFYSNDKKIEVSKCKTFGFTLQGALDNEEYPKFSFTISITRIPGEFFLRNRRDNCSWYVSKIIVNKIENKWSSWRDSDSYQFDSKTDDSQEKLKELFQILMDTYKKDLEEKENEKINLYIKEAKKLHSKDFVRDEKIDKLLS